MKTSSLSAQLSTWSMCALLWAASPALAAEYKLNAENTTITYVGAKPNGQSHTGTFKKLAGTLDLPEDVTKLKLEVVIEVESITSDNAQLTAHLKNPDFFEVAKYPQAKFVAKEVKVEGDKTVVTGEMTLHGKTEALSFPIKVERGESPKLTADFILSRKKWGMTFGAGQVNDEVKVTVTFDSKKAPPAAK